LALELDLNFQQELIRAIAALSKGDEILVDSPAIVALVVGSIALLSSLSTN